MKILAVNPGSTSTKIAVYEDETPRLVLNIRHSVEELSQFPRIIDQFEFRKHLVLEALEANDIPFKFDAIVGRGGLLKPIPGGVYAVNDAMLDDMLHAMRTHACNLGCLDSPRTCRHAARLPLFHSRSRRGGRTGRCGTHHRFASDAQHHHLARLEPASHRPALCCRA